MDVLGYCLSRHGDWTRNLKVGNFQGNYARHGDREYAKGQVGARTKTDLELEGRGHVD